MAGSSTLVTCFRLPKDKAINASTLQTWRTDYLDVDDVFHPSFLQEIIFTGVDFNDIHLSSDTERLFQDWQTVRLRYELNLDVKSGPYYIHNGILHSVWKVEEDRQLAFVQAVWPVADKNDG